jgi:hypothetical protein
VNAISPGIIMTRLALDELQGPRGAGYQRMIELSSARRAGTADEVANLAALLMGPDGGFITGSDFLDGWCNGRLLVWRPCYLRKVGQPATKLRAGLFFYGRRVSPVNFPNMRAMGRAQPDH